MKAWTATAMGLLLAGWLTAAAWSQMHLPKGLEGVIPNYPGATVTFAQDRDNSSQAIMETDDNPRAVMVFYRKAMIYREWTILTGMELERGVTIVFSKEDMRLQITSKASEGKSTTILVSIDR